MSQFNFDDRPFKLRKQSNSRLKPAVIGVCGVAVAALAILGIWLFQDKPIVLRMEPVEPQIAKELETLSVTLKTTAVGLKTGDWTYELLSGPTGAKVNGTSGLFTWTPDESQGPGEHLVTIAVHAKADKRFENKQSFRINVQEVNQAPEITSIATQNVMAGEVLQVAVKAKDDDQPAQRLSFRLKQKPPGAKIDASSGVLTWNAPETSTGQDHLVEVVVTDDASDAAESRITFTIHVEPPVFTMKMLVSKLENAGLSVADATVTTPPGFTGMTSGFRVDGDSLTILEYETESTVDDELKQVTDTGQTLFGSPATWSNKTAIFRKGSLIILFGGKSPRVLKALSDELGQPYVVAEASPMKPKTEKPIELSVQDKFVDSLVKLHEKKRLLGKVTDYPVVRKLFTELFEKQNEDLLAKRGEGDGAGFKKWLDEHTEFKEEFFTAVAPEDDFPAACKILQLLQQKHRKHFDDYGHLAIAVALTWDNEQNIDHYDHHAKRTHAVMPSTLLDDGTNFEYFVEMAEAMQGRARYLPWEFLIYLVNHKTPRIEREWAVENYAARRAMYGKCYSDVPYDYEMLKSSSRICRLGGSEYSLPNILQLGGVCAMQADFASRVGKSIGVPAEYVAGESAGGDQHAWVMWVELKQVSPTGMTFSLESHGRYSGDKYYVGHLRDPQTGKRITDRELELRLQAVGQNPVAFHHAKLVMQAFPYLRDKLAWKPAQQIVFLNSVIDLCPGNETAWQQVALLAREGKIGTDSAKLVTIMIDKLFRTFTNFPDFTWTVFDDLVQYQKQPKQRFMFYERLVHLYEAAERPDLSCEARLKLSDYLLQAGRPEEVIEGLAFTIKKFPDEGRYVPQLLDKLEKVCNGTKGADQLLLQFYLDFIPQIPQRRGNEPSPYCMRMLERAISKFNEAGQPQQAQVFAQQLAQLKSPKAPGE